VCLVISDDAERFASAIERARIKGGSAGRRKIDDDDRPAGKSIINLKRNTDAGTPHKPWCVYRVCVRFSTLTRGRSTTLYAHCVYVCVVSPRARGHLPDFIILSLSYTLLLLSLLAANVQRSLVRRGRMAQRRALKRVVARAAQRRKQFRI